MNQRMSKWHDRREETYYYFFPSSMDKFNTNNNDQCLGLGQILFL